MDSADVRGLMVGDVSAREERLHELLNRAAAGDQSAVAALRAMVVDYRTLPVSLYSRAMNRASLFVDASLEAPLLAALADAEYGCRAWAAMGCRALRLRAAVPQLRVLLDAEDWLLRAEAAAALGAAGDESSVPDLSTALRHPELSTREAAAAALAELGGDAALDALWQEFDRSASQRIGYVASVLARFGPRVAFRLRETAVDGDPNRRYWAAIALGATGDDQFDGLLRSMVEDSSTTAFGRQVKVAAKQALRTLARIRAANAERGADEW